MAQSDISYPSIETLNVIAGNLQAVTDLGNTTTNPLITQTPAQYSLALITPDGDAGLGFTMEAGGWNSIYLGSGLPFVAPGTSDKANIYLGVYPAQSQTPGGNFNVFIGYQSGIGHNGSDRKFYLAEGSSLHLLYGDFATGDLWIKHGLKIGDCYDGDGPTIPSAPGARLDIVPGTNTLAPIKLNAGVNLTTPVNGTLEYDGTNLYFTTGGVRKTVTLV